MNDIRYGRKRKGIKKDLDDKISEWIDSISNLEVQKAVERDTIVTGGSIASMLLGERVNDYDVYFRTKSTALKVAQYYADVFNNKQGIEIVEVKEETIKNIKGEDEDRVVLWVGSSGVAEDKDFEPVRDEHGNVVGESGDEEEIKKYLPSFFSQNAITLTNKIQIVTRFYGEPEKIHGNYDYVHAMNYYDFGKRELVLHPEALEALLSRTLVYKGSLYPIASVFRMKKFLERGWRITAGEQLKIMWQISELDLTDIHTLREQLTGVDMLYMRELIEVAENLNKDQLNSSYMGEVIDRIFD